MTTSTLLVLLWFLTASLLSTFDLTGAQYLVSNQTLLKASIEKLK